MSNLSNWQDDIKSIEQAIDEGFERRARVEYLEGLLREIHDSVERDVFVDAKLMLRIRAEVGSELQ